MDTLELALDEDARGVCVFIQNQIHVLLCYVWGCHMFIPGIYARMSCHWNYIIYIGQTMKIARNFMWYWHIEIKLSSYVWVQGLAATNYES